MPSCTIVGSSYQDKDIYTPEEFVEKWSLLYSEGSRGVDNYKDFALKNPYIASKQFAELKKIHL